MLAAIEDVVAGVNLKWV